MTQKTKLIAIIIALILLVNGGFIIIYFLYFSPIDTADQSQKTSTQLSDEQQAALEVERLAEQQAFDLDYYLIRFTYGDAVQVCYQEVEDRNSNLIQKNLNDLSTQFNEEKGVYIVEVDTVVGTPLEYDEKSHTCHVDPKTQGITYYKEVLRLSSVRPAE